MPLVFFMPAVSFIKRRIYLFLSLVPLPWHFETSFENAGLTSNVRYKGFVPLVLVDSTSLNFVQGLVYRYDVSKSSDGAAEEEVTFRMCTLICTFLPQPPKIHASSTSFQVC